MKPIQLFVAISAAMVFNSCGGDYQDYIITNASDCQVVVKGFRMLTGDVADPIVIAPGEQYVVQRYYGEGSDERHFYSIGLIDSVRVEFNGEKLLVAKCKEGATNCKESALSANCNDCYLLLPNLAINVIITQEDCDNAGPM